MSAMFTRLFLFFELVLRSIFPPFFSFSRIERVLKEKLEINPNNDNVLWFLAILYLMDRRYSEAQVPLETLLKIRKDSKRIKLRLSQVYFNTRQYYKVVQVLSSPEVISYKGIGNYYFGMSLLNLGEFDDAINYLENYVNYYSNSYEAFFGLGCAYFKQGLYERALKSFKKAESLNPSSKEIKSNINLCITMINERQSEETEKLSYIH
jgi:tetratricopeptide (TPR) repeat protein